MNNKATLLMEISSRKLRVGVIGMGYVGLPLAVGFAEAGFTVIGIDANSEKVKMLNKGQSYVEDVPDEVVGKYIATGNLLASTSYADLQAVYAISICVPTPLSKTKDPDISYIVDAVDRLVQYGTTGKLIVLESTTSKE